ncbi:3-hydroxyacyl-CoA dehydrogenase, partial [Streptomyces sp. NPDC002454]
MTHDLAVPPGSGSATVDAPPVDPLPAAPVTPAGPTVRAAALSGSTATLRKRTAGAPCPAPRAILAAAVEGAQVDFA